MIKQYCIGRSRDYDMSMIIFVLLNQILDGGWNEGLAWFLQLAFCTSFQRGEGRNGRTLSGWG